MNGQVFIMNQNYVLLWQQKEVGINYLINTTGMFGNSYFVMYFKDVVKNNYKLWKGVYVHSEKSCYR